MKYVISRVSFLGRLRAVRVLATLASASLLIAPTCSESVEEIIDAVRCTSDADCVGGCETLCLDAPVLSSECNEAASTCVCDCDTSGAGGAGGGGGGTGGSGADGGAGGMAGTPGSTCGGDTECTPEAPSHCGTLCIEPICGGIDNFDTAGCGENGRCICLCIEGDCSEPL